MTKTTVRALLTAVAVICALVAQPFTVNGASGDYPPAGCVLSVSVSQPDPGEPFTVTANVQQPTIPPETAAGYVPPDPITAVTFTFDGQTYVVAVVNNQAVLQLFAPTVPGVFPGTVECGEQTVDYDVSVPTVTVPPTGSDSTSSGLMIGAWMLGLGGVMVIVAHRRRGEPSGEPAVAV